MIVFIVASRNAHARDRRLINTRLCVFWSLEYIQQYFYPVASRGLKSGHVVLRSDSESAAVSSLL